MKKAVLILIGTFATAAALLFVCGFAVDTVTGATAFYTNSARTVVYPNNYTSTFIVNILNRMPIVYGGEHEADTVAWVENPVRGGTFNPSSSSISQYRWTPTAVGLYVTALRCQNPSSSSDGYQQNFYFDVIPEPCTVALLAATLALLRRRAR